MAPSYAMATVSARLCRALSVNPWFRHQSSTLSGGAVRNSFTDARDLADFSGPRSSPQRRSRLEQKKGGQQGTLPFASLGRASAHRGAQLRANGGTGGHAEWPGSALLCPRTAEALTLQRERCKSVPAAARNMFDEWCASNGVLDELEAAFRVCPFPRSYFGTLADFEDRVLRPHGVEMQNELGKRQ